jgi:hypothetical protein
MVILSEIGAGQDKRPYKRLGKGKTALSIAIDNGCKTGHKGVIGYDN